MACRPTTSFEGKRWLPRESTHIDLYRPYTWWIMVVYMLRVLYKGRHIVLFESSCLALNGLMTLLSLWCGPHCSQSFLQFWSAVCMNSEPNGISKGKKHLKTCSLQKGWNVKSKKKQGSAFCFFLQSLTSGRVFWSVFLYKNGNRLFQQQNTWPPGRATFPNSSD